MMVCVRGSAPIHWGVAAVGLIAMGLGGQALAQNWANSGGNAGRNGLVTTLGPDAPELLWSGGRTALFPRQPVTDGATVYMVRQPWSDSEDSPVIAMDIATGAELWLADIPYTAGDGEAWLAGARNGMVFACRSGRQLYALDGGTGAVVWVSEDTIGAGPIDGVVFAPNADLLVGEMHRVLRIDFDTGATIWETTRQCSNGNSCGPASSGEAVYIADAASGGQVIKRLDIATGVIDYQGPVMPGTSLQNTPMVGYSGRIFLSRTEDNPAVDSFYAFEDTGSGINQLWSHAAGHTTFSEFCVGIGNSVYMIGPAFTIQRRDQMTGALLHESASIAADFLSPRMAADRAGRVFFCNGSYDDGWFYSFNADLTHRWDVPARRVLYGAPAIGQDGTLIIAAISTDVRAYRTDRCTADFDLNGEVNTQDVLAFLNAWVAGEFSADINGDGTINTQDVLVFLNLWNAGC